MGTLDEAIREHLELKRRQGAGEDELKKAEAEAFGPAEDDDVPGASITAPAGEGDQLDKVFSGETGGGEPATTVMKAEEALAESEPTDAPEAEAPDSGPAAVEETVVVEAAPAPEVIEEEVMEEAEKASEAAPDQEESPAPEPAADEGDASDLLEAERANLTGHPTENYDVDAAIAEEQELDILSEGRLSEELDRALDDPGMGIPDGLGGEADEEPSAEVVEEVEEVEEVEVTEEVEEAPEPEATPEGGQEPEADSPLEETPDFLEDAPASDELWFEQGEPKDFDFGD
ncbi:MAG: hypothetical protein ACO3ZZ_01380 [Solirubrobacterales bacterium]